MVARGRPPAQGARSAGPACRAQPGQRQVRHIDFEPPRGIERRDRGGDGGILGRELPGAAAATAVQVGVLARGQDMELLATVGTVTVAEDAQLLEHIERAVDRRRDRVRIDRATALDELGAGHVAVGIGQDLDQDPALRGPPQAARPQSIRDPGPWQAGLDGPGRR